MLNEDEATGAIRELNGAVLNGNRLNVEVCRCGFERRNCSAVVVKNGVLDEVYLFHNVFYIFSIYSR